MYKISLVHLRIKPRQTCHYLHIGNHTKALKLKVKPSEIRRRSKSKNQSLGFKIDLLLSLVMRMVFPFLLLVQCISATQDPCLLSPDRCRPFVQPPPQFGARNNGLCFYCGKPGHFRRNCPEQQSASSAGK